MYIQITKPVELIAAKTVVNTDTGEEWKLSALVKDLWVLLLSYKSAYGKGNIYPTHDQLIDNLDTTAPTLRKAIATLKAIGAIVITEHKKAVKGLSRDWEQCNHSYKVTAPAYIENREYLNKEGKPLTNHYFIPHYKRHMRDVL